ncbi:sugar-binding transcriptional regulator [Pseudophaeobacter flagellatus]|uniref:sugar-binding transcriptional regulator n=1 Tax=Pseudophaeobacter flagellatus TaxID=2899119 RepID=UPI001E501CC4|nr:sugar-binding transcriptional regulator [Pseudophaeobacter flagellatus]MCD9149968.1 sugar-binding transcriptional regulator [Pseudophaeobacter flagellatus]
MTEASPNYETARQIHAVLVLHFVEGLKQSEIATKLNLSTSKVNRLIAQGRRMGMVKIDIKSRFQHLIDCEEQMVRTTGLNSAVITPTASGNPDTTLQQVGRAAANFLLETLRDGDVIAITGGKAISAVVENLTADIARDVTVVPLTGGVQGKYFTDVNHLATQLAERLGGRAMLVHAPLFAETRAQRDMLMEVGSVRDVFDIARKANVALLGIGSIQAADSSYYDLNPVPEADRKMLANSGVVAELLAHLIGDDGRVADYPLNHRLVALDPGDLAECGRVIGIASGLEKARPIRATLNGGYLDALVLDEETALNLLNPKESKPNVA